jgi:hypothetical protein
MPTADDVAFRKCIEVAAAMLCANLPDDTSVLGEVDSPHNATSDAVLHKCALNGNINHFR